MYSHVGINWLVMIRGPVAKKLENTLSPSVYEHAIRMAGACLGLGDDSKSVVKRALDFLESAAADQKLPEADIAMGSWQAFGAIARDQFGQFAGMHRIHPNVKADKKLVEECGLFVNAYKAISIAGTLEDVEHYMKSEEFATIAGVQGHNHSDLLPVSIMGLSTTKPFLNSCWRFHRSSDYMPTAYTTNFFEHDVYGTSGIVPCAIVIEGAFEGDCNNQNRFK